MKPGGTKLYQTDFDEMRVCERFKLNKDVQIIQKAFEEIRSFVGEKSNIHFIIGSKFYMKFRPFYAMRAMLGMINTLCYGDVDPIEKVIWFMMHQSSRLKLVNSTTCSFLTGAVITLRRVFKLEIYNNDQKSESPLSLKV